MKKLSLIALLLISAGALWMPSSYASAAPKKTPAKVKASTAKKKISKVRIKTVVDKIENGAIPFAKSYKETMPKIKQFFSSTMSPFIASKFPAKSSLSLSGKAELLSQEVEKYIDNTPEYSQYTHSMGFAMTDIAQSNLAVSYALMIEIDEQLPNPASKKAWQNYCSKIIDFSNALFQAAYSNAVCSVGNGSFILYEGPSIYNRIQKSLQTMLKEDLRALKGQKIVNKYSSSSHLLSKILKRTEESMYDPDIYEDIPDTEKSDLKKARKELKQILPECEEAHAQWVKTLPASTQSLMTDNLNTLLSSSIWEAE